MKLTKTKTGSAAVLQMEGSLVIDDIARAKSELSEALKGAQSISVDLSRITECDAAGLQLILMASASMKARNGAFAVTATSPELRQAIDRAGLRPRTMGIGERRA